jgi:signal transduction histidine kinase
VLVQEALARGPDHWIVSALNDALGRARSETLVARDVVSDAYARGLRDTTSALVHELRRFLGFAKLSAGAEVSEYETSQTRRDLERLSDLLDAVERLGLASESGPAEDFDLSELLLETIAREAEVFGVEILDRGPRPVLVVGERRLVELAARTGVVNACEALKGFESDSDRPLVVAWDRTDRDAWISVIDQGPGPSEDLLDPFEFAATTKDEEEHLGVGLAIAKRAVASLGGSISLRAGATAGAVYEVRWPQPMDSRDANTSG